MMCKTPRRTRVSLKEHKSALYWMCTVHTQWYLCVKCVFQLFVSFTGYYAERNAIIVFSACFLPDSNCENYSYVMENLFLYVDTKWDAQYVNTVHACDSFAPDLRRYVINTLELLVAEDYMIVYLNGATPRRRLPGFTWIKKCYQMIDRR